MKEILSYCDIFLGLLSISLGICRLIKYEKYRKKRDNELLKKCNGKWELSYSRFMENRIQRLRCNILILVGIVFIYNRLNGNLPNIIELIKEFASY